MSAVTNETLQKIGHQIATQDNQYTDQPIFIVQQKRMVTGFDPRYLDDDQIGWFDCDGMATPEEAKNLEAEYQQSYKEPDGWYRTGFSTYWEFVTACFTEQGCMDYLAINGHNLTEPRIYAYGSDRNNEFRTVREYLLGLAAKPSCDEVKS